MNTATAPLPVSQSGSIRTLLASPRTAENRAELSECGIGYLREYASHHGWSRAGLAGYLQESLDLARVGNCTPDTEGLTIFCRVPRAGRGMRRSTRAAKVAAFAQLVGRGRI